MKPAFTGDETVADILETMPEASDILLAHGLSCVSCHINQFEALNEGVLGHGMTQEDLDLILEDLNEAAAEFGIKPGEKRSQKDPVLTTKAKSMIERFQQEQKKPSFGLKVEVMLSGNGEKSYYLDLQEKPDTDDRVLESEGVKLFVSPESHNLLKNHQIDYVSTDEGEGFKIEKI